MFMAAPQITDRAHRYRANKLAPGGRKACAYCGSTRNVVPDHIDGVPDHTVRSNLQWLCKSCNTKKGAAFAKAGKGRLTHQYNPSSGEVPTLKQYAWAVGNHDSKNHAHDEGGAIIHATPPDVRSEYARAMAGKSQRTKREMADERYNPAGDSEAGRAAAGLGTADRARALKRHIADVESDLRRKLSKGELQVLRGRWSEGVKKGRKSNPWPFSRPDARQTTPASGGVAAHQKRKAPADRNAEFLQKVSTAGRYRGYTISKTADGEFYSSLDPGSWFSTKLQAQRHVDQYMKGRANPSFPLGSGKYTTKGTLIQSRKGADGITRQIWRVPELKWAPYACVMDGKVVAQSENLQDARDNFGWHPKRNPAAASADAFEDFHGFKPSEVITVTKKIHHHEHLAAAGKLVSLDVWGIDGQGHKVTGFRGAFLAFNEDRNQLFVEGGDQSIDLKDYGIKRPHEMETLGQLTDIGYQTNKTHLGDEGGEAVYVHKFRSTNENGKHVVVKIARYPDLIYDARNEQLLFSGGSYEILREGIDK